MYVHVTLHDLEKSALALYLNFPFFIFLNWDSPVYVYFNTYEIAHILNRNYLVCFK